MAGLAMAGSAISGSTMGDSAGGARAVAARAVAARAVAIAGLLWCAVLVSACGGGRLPSPELEIYDLGGDFSLLDHRGQEFSLADQRGRVCFLFFGFTSCRDICPVTLSRLGSAQDMLGEGAAATRILFVTVDPQRDTPERLAEYLQGLGERAIGLTGQPDEIRAMARAFGAGFEREDTGDDEYNVDHTSRAYLLDQRGRVRYLFSQEDSPELIAGAAAQLL